MPGYDDPRVEPSWIIGDDPDLQDAWADYLEDEALFGEDVTMSYTEFAIHWQSQQEDIARDRRVEAYIERNNLDDRY